MYRPAFCAKCGKGHPKQTLAVGEQVYFVWRCCEDERPNRPIDKPDVELMAARTDARQLGLPL